MSSRTHYSEDVLARLGCRRASAIAAPVVLIGGLGMGFTLRAALDALPATASVIVAELVPEVLAWNRGPLASLAEHPLDDPRVRVELDDVGAVMRARPRAFDVVLLDVDNGPVAFADTANARLYEEAGIANAHRSLQPGGVLAVWSANDTRAFARRLRARGFGVESHRVGAGPGNRGQRYTIVVATAPPSGVGPVL
ncbi:MAG: hypothetical protein IT184_15540 [Acidobacteria bacterium]|nr:hypothetical protein [Acidobacteriota bacterium]